MTKTQSTPKAVSLDEIKPGMIIKFKRFECDKRSSGMVVDLVDGDFLEGRTYHLGHGVVGYRRVLVYVGSSAVIELIGSVA